MSPKRRRTAASLRAVVPQEIVDSIIDYASTTHTDWSRRQPAATCALVHRNWLPASRRHLFRSVRISGDSREQKWTEILNSPHATFPHHVRELTFVSSLSNPEQSLEEASALFNHSGLVHIEKLSLACVMIDATMFRSPLSVFANVKHLCIEDIVVRGSAVILLSFLSHFSSLTRLELSDLNMKTSTTVVSQVPISSYKAPSELRAIVLSNADCVELLQWPSASSLKLTELSLATVEYPRPEVMTDLLRRGFGTLTKLRLDNFEPVGFPNIDFSTFPTLRALYLQVQEQALGSDWLYTALSTILPPCPSPKRTGLQVLAFDVPDSNIEHDAVQWTDSAGSGEEHPARWPKLDSLFQTPSFSVLKELCFFLPFEFDVEDSELVDYVNQVCLPKCGERHIVTFVSEYVILEPNSWEEIPW